MTGNFSFLQSHFPVLATFGSQAEQYCYTDSNSCLMKLGMMGETIVNLMYSYDNIPLPEPNNAATRIDRLFHEDMLDQRLADILHTLRKKRNKAVHDNYESIADDKALLPMAYSVCEWFMETYGDWQYTHRDYILPQEKVQAATLPKITQSDEALADQAVQEASSIPPTAIEARRRQAQTAANNRYISEAETRYLIDEQLRRVGWEADTPRLRYSRGTRPQKGKNLAIAEWPVSLTNGQTGYADYALFTGLSCVAVVEAKAMHKDIPSVIDLQGKTYAKKLRLPQTATIGTWNSYSVPFIFATNGRPYIDQLKTKSGIWWLDVRQEKNIPIALRGWMSPQGIEELLNQDREKADTSLSKLSYKTILDPAGLHLRYYQVEAVKAVEKAILRGQQHILLAMATGTGKTRTILGLIYRLLVAKRFRHILFLVDRNALGQQAMDTFCNAKIEQLQTLHQLYDIKSLTDTQAGRETRLHIATVQSMVKRILYADGETMPSVTDYDAIIVDEAHRGYILDKSMSDDEQLYRNQADYQSKYRAVMDYFQAVKIGMTATPALQTTQIFGLPVYTYTYRQAVVDGYLIDHDAPHHIQTKLSQEGIHFAKGDRVEAIDPVTGALIHGATLPDELDFNVEAFNRRVITEPFNRAVLTEISKDLYPADPQRGKTLIFAANDQHADMIVQILRDIYQKEGLHQDAILKITGKSGGGNRAYIDNAIRRFKNERYPNIVVTVDLLTTGIDVPEITTLVFLRLVKSRILFEQMLGRATRVCPAIHKDHFEIYDPVGVYEYLQSVTSMKPVVAAPQETFADLLKGLEVLDNPTQTTTLIQQIIAKTQRKWKGLSDTDRRVANSLCGSDVMTWLIDLKGRTPMDTRNRLLAKRSLFTALDAMSSVRHGVGILISHAPDHVIDHRRTYGAGEATTTRPEDYLEAFTSYVKNHIQDIDALYLLCTRPKALTRPDLIQLTNLLSTAGYTAQQLNTAVSAVTNETMTADLISLIRRAALGSTLMSHEARIRRAVERLKKAHQFTAGELKWLQYMEQYLMTESVLTKETFDTDSRFKRQGGFDRLNKRIFKNKLEYIVDELNTYLYDDGGKLG